MKWVGGLRALFGGRKPSPEDSAVVVGGLYGWRGADGRFRVSKVLLADADAVHVRMYSDRFDALPHGINSADLSLGVDLETGSFGIGHTPVSRQGFLREPHTLLASEPVRDDELDGYRIWAGEEEAGDSDS